MEAFATHKLAWLIFATSKRSERGRGREREELERILKEAGLASVCCMVSQNLFYPGGPIHHASSPTTSFPRQPKRGSWKPTT